jgi:hypothetical protein
MLGPLCLADALTVPVLTCGTLSEVDVVPVTQKIVVTQVEAEKRVEGHSIQWK